MLKFTSHFKIPIRINEKGTSKQRLQFNRLVGSINFTDFCEDRMLLLIKIFGFQKLSDDSAIET